MSDRTIVDKSLRLKARAETVFRFLTEPDFMRRWIGLAVEFDPRPGGIVRIDPNGQDVVRGEVVEVVPGRKIVFTWGWEDPGVRLPPGASRVEITLTPDGDETVLRLRHLDLRDEDLEGHRSGWDHYLARLGVAATGGDPGPDPIARPEIRHGFPETGGI